MPETCYSRQIITDDTFQRHQGFDLASFDDKNLPASELPQFRILKTETYSTFKQRIADYFKLPPGEFRLWVLVNRQNKTIRPDVPIPESDGPQSKCVSGPHTLMALIMTLPQPWTTFVPT